MNKINVRVKDKNTLEILEDAKSGDIIDLSEITTIDLDFINQLILKGENEYVESRLKENDLAHKNEIEQINIKNDLETQNKIHELEAKHNELVSELNNKYQKELEEKKDASNKQIYELRSKITSLEQDNKNLNLNINDRVEIEARKVADALKEKYEHILSEKDKLLSNAKHDLEIKEINEKNTLQVLKLENDKILNEVVQKGKEEKAELENEIDRLKRKNDSKAVKLIGEDLERWCNEEFKQAALAGFENCEWHKDNDSVKDELDLDDKATKADYIFKMYADSNFTKENEITSVCLEMKNEAFCSATKQTNASHYKKLDKDRNKKECEYALLVSELEWEENDAPIKKVSEYEKMYVVRPQFMITFLSIVYSLGQRYKNLLKEIKDTDEELRDINDINEEFEHFKETYVLSPIGALEKQIDKINKNASSIIQAANNIQAETNLMISKTISTIYDKINTFTIKKDKLIKKIDKINNK